MWKMCIRPSTTIYSQEKWYNIENLLFLCLQCGNDGCYTQKASDGMNAHLHI